MFVKIDAGVLLGVKILLLFYSVVKSCSKDDWK